MKYLIMSIICVFIAYTISAHKVISDTGASVKRNEKIVLASPIEKVAVAQQETLQAIADKPAAPAPAVAASGSHTDWMAAAGIPSDVWSCVEFVISHESGWRPTAANPSGAYGLPQALPGEKMASAGADWQTNPVTQLKWADGYANARYGGWCGAMNAWQSKHWW